MLDIAYVDVIDVCHLKCPTCIRGVRGMENTARKMSVATFERVVCNLKAEGYGRIAFFSWTEPFLNRNLQDYVAAVKTAGLRCELSSTLSLRHIDNLESALVAGVDWMIVSMSGIEQATHERNHVGGTLEYVFANLQKIREIIDRHSLSTEISVRFIKFDYNLGEVERLRAYAESMRFDFNPIDGVGHPDHAARLRNTMTPGYFDRGMAEGQKQPLPTREKVCALMFDQITVDCEADVYLCCAFPNYEPLKIGNYLDLSEEEILARRYQHSFCRVCTWERRDATAGDHQRLTAAFATAT